MTQKDDGNGLVRVGADIVSVGISQTGSPLFRLVAAEGDTVFIDSTWNNETFAVFGQTTYSFSETWEATLGLRYTSEEKEADLFSEPFSTAPLFGTGNSLMEIAYGYVDDSFKRSSDDVTGLVSLSYFVAQDTMLFASVSTGSKSGGFNGGAGTGDVRAHLVQDARQLLHLGLPGGVGQRGAPSGRVAAIIRFSVPVTVGVSW